MIVSEQENESKVDKEAVEKLSGLAPYLSRVSGCEDRNGYCEAYIL